MEALITLLVLSVTVNYFLGGAYIKMLREYNEMKEWEEELVKLYGSIDKLAEKRKKLVSRRKGAK
jgi:ABC-type siderophore export system fused ATPase/permease subunit